jgi:PEP-CTERM motif-containing protein
MKPSFAAFALILGLAAPIAASPTYQMDLRSGGTSSTIGMPGLFFNFSSGWGPYRCPPACVLSNAPMYDPLSGDVLSYTDMLGSMTESSIHTTAVTSTGSPVSSLSEAVADPPELIPEPATLSLFATGLVAMAMRRRSSASARRGMVGR